MRPHTCCQILFGISMHCFDDKRKGSLQQQKQICPSENEVNIITSELLLNASALTGHVKPKFILMGLVKEPSGKVSGTWKELEPSTGVTVPP